MVWRAMHRGFALGRLGREGGARGDEGWRAYWRARFFRNSRGTAVAALTGRRSSHAIGLRVRLRQ